MITSYEKLLESLVQGQVRFALVGGLAVSLNGFVRTTDDVDILVDNSSTNIEKLAAVLRNFGEGYGGDLTPADFNEEPGAIRVQEDFDLDLFVRMNGKSLADLGQWIQFHPLKSGIEIPYLKAEGLIETKSGSAREKDRLDIAALHDILARSGLRNQAPQPVTDFDSLRGGPTSPI